MMTNWSVSELFSPCHCSVWIFKNISKILYIRTEYYNSLDKRRSLQNGIQSLSISWLDGGEEQQKMQNIVHKWPALKDVRQITFWAT
jgi:hypothetical protein